MVRHQFFLQTWNTRMTKVLAVAILIIAACTQVLFGSSAPSSDDELTISVVPNNLQGETKAIDLDKSIRIVLTNNSEKEIVVADQFSAEGYYALSFEWKNETTGEITTTKKAVVGPEYFQSANKRLNSREKKLSILPGEKLEFEVALLSIAWGNYEWTGLPEPNTEVVYSLKARYQFSAPSNYGYWNGSIESDSVSIRVVSTKLETPHRLLRHGLTQAAINLMKKDRTWINRKRDSETPLHVAARMNQLDAVTWLLKNKADVNAFGYNGCTALISTTDPKIVEVLLRYSPNLETESFDGTPLQRAVIEYTKANSEQARKNWQTIARQLRSAGANYDAVSAIYLNDLKRVKEILEVPTLPPLINKRDFLLKTAASIGKIDICKYLIEEQKVDVDQFEEGSGYPIIKYALKHPSIVNLLIENGADLETRITWKGGRSGKWIIGDEATALHYAACDGVHETIKLLIDAGVDIFATTVSFFPGSESEIDPIEGDSSASSKQVASKKEHIQTALDVAAYFGKADNARAIVTHAAFQNADKEIRQKTLDRCLVAGSFASSLSARDADRPELIKVLLDAGANPNAESHKGSSAIQVAARCIRPSDTKENQQQMQIIDLLVQRGGQLDLFSAVATGNEEAVKIILKSDPDSKDARAYDGLSALDQAITMDQQSIVRLLLEAGAQVDSRNKSTTTGGRGGTPLQCAAFWGRLEIAKMLIEFGADVNAKSDDNVTPLHEAVRLGNVDIVKLLLEHRARFDIRDKFGDTAVDRCKKVDSVKAEQMQKLFHEYGEPKARGE